MAKRRRKSNDRFITLISFIFTIYLIFFVFSIPITPHFYLAIGAILFISASLFIFKRYKKRARLNDIRRSGITDIDKMDGRQFEHYLGLLFKSHGYKSDVTQASGDFGADLILRKSGKTIVVQAKRYKSNIGIKAVQEVQAAVAHYRADEAWVVTNRDFTAPAVALAKSNGVKLIGRQSLMSMVLANQTEQSPVARNVIQDVPYENKKCKSCGSKMVLRKSVKGEFWGCTQYPTCNNIVDITH